MNILTIDIDFISGHYLQDKLAKNAGLSRPTEFYWDSLLEYSGVMPHTIEENKHNVRFIFDLFLKVVLKNDNIVFGYHHDAILNHIDLDSDEKIKLVNVDHHHDISYCTKHNVETNMFNECSEADWVELIKYKIIFPEM